MSTESPRPQLGAHAEALIADVLDRREQAIIAGVISQLPKLDPQAALAAWITLAEARKLRNSLIKRSELAAAQHRAQI